MTASAGSEAPAGSFIVKVTHTATATSLSSTRTDAKGPKTMIGPGVDQTAAALSSAGFSLTPTAGTFTINGHQITITGGQSLDDVVAAINLPANATGVTASVTNDAQ